MDLGVHNFIIVASGRLLTFLGCGLIICTLGLAGTVLDTAVRGRTGRAHPLPTHNVRAHI